MKISHETLNVLLDCYSYAGQNSEVPLLKFDRDNPQNYTVLAPLACGSYGDVFVVQNKNTKKLYALKRLSKSKVKNQPTTALFTAERNCMIDCRYSKRLISVYTTFHTPSHLFFLMDFYPGGDFLSLLSHLEILPDEYIRFYAMELILAVKELHNLGYIHRDIKPDNILITQTGHIRLGDFGSCAKTVNGIVKSNVSVGTPDYISPEVLTSVNSVAEYSYEVDVWSIGVVIYEMINGETPFYSTSLMETYKRISLIEYKNVMGSDEIKQVIASMVCAKEERKSLDEIMLLPFFEGIDWNTEMESPYIPGKDWSINFQDSGFNDDEEKNSVNIDSGQFIGFSFDENVILIDEKIDGKSGEDTNIKPRIDDNKVSDSENTGEMVERMLKITPEIDNTLLTLENNMKMNKLRISKMLVRETMSRIQMYIENISSQHELISYYVDHLNMQNNHLKIEIRKKQSKVDCESAMYVDELKKDMRQRKNRIRELEQRVDEEVFLRKNLQDEIKYLKSQVKNLHLKAIDVKREFLCRRIIFSTFNSNISTGKKDFTYKNTKVLISNDTIVMDEFEDKMCNVFIDDCNDNEMYFLGERKKALTVKLVFMIPKDNQTMTSAKSEEDILEEMKNEERILASIEKIISLTKDKVREDAIKQKEGSQKRIEELENEMSLIRSGTIISVDKTNRNNRLKEFKNHKFTNKTFQTESICYHCQQLLYGTDDQGLECIDCSMITHKSCYILIKESCELHKSIKGGRLNYIMLNSIEEKSKILKMFNHL